MSERLAQQSEACELAGVTRAWQAGPLSVYTCTGAHRRGDEIVSSYCDNSMREKDGVAASVARRRRKPARAISLETRAQQ